MESAFRRVLGSWTLKEALDTKESSNWASFRVTGSTTQPVE